jgi:NAD(P)-dependent dehydrogenase (short-subunit alcohol dehydrogenase family)
MPGLLEGKRALITGASSGIGLGIARVFAREGANLVITCQENVQGMAHAVTQLRQSGARAAGMQVDITVIEEIDALMAAAVRELGCLDVKSIASFAVLPLFIPHAATTLRDT